MGAGKQASPRHTEYPTIQRCPGFPGCVRGPSPRAAIPKIQEMPGAFGERQDTVGTGRAQTKFRLNRASGTHGGTQDPWQLQRFRGRTRRDFVTAHREEGAGESPGASMVGHGRGPTSDAGTQQQGALRRLDEGAASVRPAGCTSLPPLPRRPPARTTLLVTYLSSSPTAPTVLCCPPNLLFQKCFLSLCLQPQGSG